jgi:hypothetical protein
VKKNSFDEFFSDILEGAVDTIGDKESPVAFRIIAAVILLATYGVMCALGCFFLFGGIKDGELIAVILGLILVLAFVYILWLSFRKRKK